MKTSNTYSQIERMEQFIEKEHGVSVERDKQPMGELLPILRSIVKCILNDLKTKKSIYSDDIINDIFKLTLSYYGVFLQKECYDSFRESVLFH